MSDSNARKPTKKRSRDQKEKEAAEEEVVDASMETETGADAVTASTSSSNGKPSKGAIIQVDCSTPEDRQRLGISIIAHPLASVKLSKKCLKLVSRSSATRLLRRGVKEVVKAIRKGGKGILLIAGNITPIDVVSHLPVLAEDNGIPYVFIPLKEQLGAAGMTKRPTACILIQTTNDDKHHDYFETVKAAVLKALPSVTNDQ